MVQNLFATPTAALRIMTPKEYFEPEFWALTGKHKLPIQIRRRPTPKRPKPMRPMQPTLLGQPRRNLSIWQLVAGMEAELMRAPRQS